MKPNRDAIIATALFIVINAVLWYESTGGIKDGPSIILLIAVAIKIILTALVIVIIIILVYLMFLTLFTALKS